MVLQPLHLYILIHDYFLKTGILQGGIADWLPSESHERLVSSMYQSHTYLYSPLWSSKDVTLIYTHSYTHKNKS